MQYSLHVRSFVRNFVDELFRLMRRLNWKNDCIVVRTRKIEEIDCYEESSRVTISLIEIGA